VGVNCHQQSEVQNTYGWVAIVQFGSWNTLQLTHGCGNVQYTPGCDYIPLCTKILRQRYCQNRVEVIFQLTYNQKQQTYPRCKLPGAYFKMDSSKSEQSVVGFYEGT